MLYGTSSGLVALGIVFITQGSTRLIGIFWLLAAVVLALVEWHRRNRGRQAPAAAGGHAARPVDPGQ